MRLSVQNLAMSQADRYSVVHSGVGHEDRESAGQTRRVTSEVTGGLWVLLSI